MEWSVVVRVNSSGHILRLGRDSFMSWLGHDIHGRDELKLALSPNHMIAKKGSRAQPLGSCRCR